MLDRRTVIGSGAAALALGSAMAAPSQAFFAARHLPIGLQLYTLGHAVDEDLDGALKQVAAIGYRTIEPAGYHGHSPAQLRAAADRAGLRCTSIHIQPRASGGAPGLDGDLAKLAADIHVLGADTIVMPIFLFPAAAPPPAPGEDGRTYLVKIADALTADDWKNTAAFLNEKGRALKNEGLTLAYHNHNIDFRPIGNTTGYEVLVRETDPSLVALEMDAGWVAAAGLDPVDLLHKHPGRFRLMHVKDILATTQKNFALEQDPTEVGKGMMHWPALLREAYAAGVRSFYVEQEPPFREDRFAAVAESFRYLESI